MVLAGNGKMKHHELFAAFAVITFIGHLISVLFIDLMWWLPEIVWVVSIILSALAIYGGAVTVARTEPDRKGAAIASVVIGGIVLLVLLYSGMAWLFEIESDYGTLITLR